MKNVRRISVLLLLLIASQFLSSPLLHAQSKWERIGEEGFNGVAYISATKVIAVANEGRILTSNDAGKTWTRQTIPSQTDLVGVSFSGTDRGIIIGFQQGEIFVTTNGGVTWQPPTKSINDICNQVEFVSNDTAFIIGSHGRLYRSIDGGKSWDALTTGISSGTASNLNRIQFADTRNGFAVGDSGVILRTTNGGTSWKPQQSGTKWQLLGFDLLDAQHAVAVGLDDPVSHQAGILLQTSNGGQTWTNQLVPDSLVFSVSGVKMIDALHVLVVGTQVMFRTPDGGVTWSAAIIPDVLNQGATYVGGVSFLNATQGFVVGWTGLVLSTQNSGADWKIHLLANLGQQGGSAGINNMQFSSNGIAYAVGQHDAYKSVDSGTSWLLQPSLGVLNSFQALTDLHFIDQDSGFTVELIYGRIYRTSDGGANWREGGMLDSHLGRLYFRDAKNGYVVGDSMLFHTTDNGYTWTSRVPIHLPGKLYLSKIVFENQGEGLLGFMTGTYSIPLPSGKDTNYGRVFRTRDGGNTWDRVLQDELQPIRCVYIKSQQNIFAAGNMDVLLHSSDGGDNWSELHRGTSKRTAYFDINFMNDSIGYVVGFDTAILATTDGGLTWAKEDPWFSDDLRASDEGFTKVLFPYPNTVYLCGAHTFFRKHLTPGPAGVEVTHIADYNYPGKYLYLTNIPNPASRTTDIKLYGLTDMRAYPLSLKLYDPLGLEVADLSPQVMDNLAGDESHAVWDLGSVPSGVYSARISGGPASRILRVVVIK